TPSRSPTLATGRGPLVSYTSVSELVGSLAGCWRAAPDPQEAFPLMASEPPAHARPGSAASPARPGRPPRPFRPGRPSGPDRSGRPPRPGRVRVPPPLISYRLPSGRGATEQPNASGDGEAALTPRFWAMVALTGVAAGLFGDLMMLILFTVQHLAFGYHSGTLESGVRHASDIRRLVVLLIGGAFGGISWFLLRRYTRGEKSELDDVVWGDGARLSFRRSLGTSVISEIVIGMGASIGREAAPKLMGGVSASVLAGWAKLTPAQRRLLMACGGGAGLAAVYNVPLGGALFTAEVMLGTISVPVVLPALACSWIATVTAWLYLPDRPTYIDVPSYRFTTTLLVWALLAGPL